LCFSVRGRLLGFCPSLAIFFYIKKIIPMDNYYIVKHSLTRSGKSKTCHHLFFQCTYSSKVWKSLVQGLLKDGFTTDWNTIITIISGSSYPATELFLIRYSLQAAVHSIWRERNSRRHGEEPKDAITLSKLVDKTIRLHLLAVKARGHAYLERSLRTWFGTREDLTPS